MIVNPRGSPGASGYSGEIGIKTKTMGYACPCFSYNDQLKIAYIQGRKIHEVPKKVGGLYDSTDL